VSTVDIIWVYDRLTTLPGIRLLLLFIIENSTQGTYSPMSNICTDQERAV